MAIIRKTISFTKKDKDLQDIINKCENYEVSHTVKHYMRLGMQYERMLQGNQTLPQQQIIKTEQTIEQPKEVKQKIEPVEVEEELNIDVNDLEDSEVTDEELMKNMLDEG